MKIIRFIFVITPLLAGYNAFSQLIDASKLSHMRDSLDNLLMVSPSSSAILVRRGQVELYSFSSFLTSSQFNDRQGSNAYLPGKQLLFNSTFQVNYGASRNRRVNVGFDVNYRSYRYDASKSSSMFSVLGGDPSNISALSYVGPRIRVQPFRKKHNFIYQAYLWFPIANSASRVALGTSKVDWGNTFFYYRYFKQKIGLFAQANFLLRFPVETGATTEFYVPLSLSVSYVLTPKNIVFGSLSYSWLNGDINKVTEGADNDFSQIGVGYQRIVTKRFFINLNYAKTTTARNYAVWNSLNFGLRYLY